MLGVRIPPHPHPDVIPNERGMVHPGRGMSVSPDWRDLPPHLIPRQLKMLAKDARGDARLRVFRHGEGPFVDGPVADCLMLHVDRFDHGVVEPSGAMAINEYQKALAETREDWSMVPFDYKLTNP